MAQCSDASLIQPRQVESLPSVLEGNYMDDGAHPSIEDLSTALVKETFVKVLSNQTFNLNDELSDETKQLIENISEAAINTITQANANNNQSLNTPNLTENPDKPEPNKPSSSTHFSSKLSEIVQTVSVDEMTDNTIDLPNRDLRISLSLIDSMSEKVESDVENTLNSNIQKLGKNFESNHDLSRRFSSVQDMGHSMLNNDVRLSKGSSSGSNASDKSSSVKLQDLDDRLKSKDGSHLEDKIVKLEADIENYKAELERLRPDTNTVVLHCNTLDIDPAIATVPHLLDLLKNAKDQNRLLHDETKELTDQLYHTTSVLEEQKELYMELKKRLKAIDKEDDRRREKHVTVISKYYEDKLKNIESELKERDIVLEEDFWIPHSTNTSEFLSKILEHRAEVAEEELQRDLSNAGTDKFSDDEPVVFPVRGFRESFEEDSHVKYLEDDDADGRSPKREFTRDKNAPIKTKTCVLQ